jgi:hypothetical protein
MLNEGFSLNQVPNNLLKMIQNDQESYQKLQRIIQSHIKVTKDHNSLATYEIVINKNMKQKPEIDHAALDLEQENDTKEEVSIIPCESFAEQFVAYKIYADSVKFKNSSSVLITFHQVNNEKIMQRIINSHL